MFDFDIVTSWFNGLLTGFMPQWAATLIECVVIGVIVLLVYALLALFYILYERKLCAWFQCRLGPMRVGRWGVLQVFADMFKILIKELICLKGTDKFLFSWRLTSSSPRRLRCSPASRGAKGCKSSTII